MKKSISISGALILILLYAIVASAFWHDILVLKWDQDESADVSGYVIKVRVTRPDGAVRNYEFKAGKVTEFQLDVIRDGEYEIKVIPVNGAGSRLDPIYELNFVPHGIPR